MYINTFECRFVQRYGIIIELQRVAAYVALGLALQCVYFCRHKCRFFNQNERV